MQYPDETQQLKQEGFFSVILITAEGCKVVPNTEPGTAFVVERFTPCKPTYGKSRGTVAHVRDYRTRPQDKPFQLWSLTPKQYNLAHTVGTE